MPRFLDLPNGGCVNVDCIISISPRHTSTGRQIVLVDMCDGCIELEVDQYDSPQKVAEALTKQLKSLCSVEVPDGIERLEDEDDED